MMSKKIILVLCFVQMAVILTKAHENVSSLEGLDEYTPWSKMLEESTLR